MKILREKREREKSKETFNTGKSSGKKRDDSSIGKIFGQKLTLCPFWEEGKRARERERSLFIAQSKGRKVKGNRKDA